MTKVKQGKRIALIAAATLLVFAAIFTLVRLNANAAPNTETLTVYLGTSGTDALHQESGSSRKYINTTYTNDAIEFIRDYFSKSDETHSFGLPGNKCFAQIICCANNIQVMSDEDFAADSDHLFGDILANSAEPVKAMDGNKIAKITVSCTSSLKPAAGEMPKVTIRFKQTCAETGLNGTKKDQNQTTYVRNNYCFENVSLAPQKLDTTVSYRIAAGYDFVSLDGVTLTFGANSYLWRNYIKTSTLNVILAPMASSDKTVTVKNTLNIQSGNFNNVYFASYSTSGATGTIKGTDNTVNISGGYINNLSATDGQVRMDGCKATVNISGGAIEHVATLGASLASSDANGTRTYSTIYKNTKAANETVDFTFNITGGTIGALNGAGYKLATRVFGTTEDKAGEGVHKICTLASTTIGTASSAYTLNGSVSYRITSDATIGNFVSGTPTTDATLDGFFMPINGQTSGGSSDADTANMRFTCAANVTVTYEGITFDAYPGIIHNNKAINGAVYETIMKDCIVNGDYAGAGMVTKVNDSAVTGATIKNTLVDTTVKGNFNGANTVTNLTYFIENTITHCTFERAYYGAGSGTGATGQANVTNTFRKNDNGSNTVKGAFYGGSNTGNVQGVVVSSVYDTDILGDFYGATGSGFVTNGKNNGAINIELDTVTVGGKFYGVTNSGGVGFHTNTVVVQNSMDINLTVKNSDIKGLVTGIGGSATNKINPKGGKTITVTFDNVQMYDPQVSSGSTGASHAFIGHSSVVGKADGTTAAEKTNVIVNLKDVDSQGYNYGLGYSAVKIYGDVTVNINDVTITKDTEATHFYPCTYSGLINGTYTLNVDGFTNATGGWFTGSTMGGKINNAYDGGEEFAITATLENVNVTGSWVAVLGSGAAATVNGGVKITDKGNVSGSAGTYYGPRVANMYTGITKIVVCIGNDDVLDEGGNVLEDKTIIVDDNFNPFIAYPVDNYTGPVFYELNNFDISGNFNPIRTGISGFGITLKNSHVGGNCFGWGSVALGGNLTTVFENVKVDGLTFSAGTNTGTVSGNVFATVINCEAMNNFFGISYSGGVTGYGKLTIDGLKAHHNFHGVSFLGAINGKDADGISFYGDYTNLEFLDRDVQGYKSNAADMTDANLQAVSATEIRLTGRSANIAGGVLVNLNSGATKNADGTDEIRAYTKTPHGEVDAKADVETAGVILLGTTGVKTGGPCTFNINGGVWSSILTAASEKHQLGDNVVVNINGGQIGGVLMLYSGSDDANTAMAGHTVNYNFNLDGNEDILLASGVDFAVNANIHTNLIAGKNALRLVLENEVRVVPCIENVVVGEGKILKVGMYGNTATWGADTNYALKYKKVNGDTANLTFRFVDVSDRTSKAIELVDDTVTGVSGVYGIKVSSVPMVNFVSLVLTDTVKVRYYFNATRMSAYYTAKTATNPDAVYVLEGKTLTPADFKPAGQINGWDYFYVDSEEYGPADFDKEIVFELDGRDDYKLCINDLLLTVANDESYGETFSNLVKALFNLGAQANADFDDQPLPELFDVEALDVTPFTPVKVEQSTFKFVAADITFEDSIIIKFFGKRGNDCDLAKFKAYVNDCDKYENGDPFEIIDLGLTTIKDQDVDTAIVVIVTPQNLAEELKVEMVYDNDLVNIASITDSGANIAKAIADDEGNKDAGVANALLAYILAAQAQFPAAE